MNSFEASFQVSPDLQTAADKAYVPLHITDAVLNAKHLKYGHARFYLVVDQFGQDGELSYQLDDDSPYAKAMERIQTLANSSYETAPMYAAAVKALFNGEFDDSDYSVYIY